MKRCKHIEALKQALEALEELNSTNSYWWQDVDEETIAKIDPAITAIKEALAQEQEPVAIVAVDGVGQIQVGWITKPQHNDKLYTSPPQRTWVGLTDDEIDSYFEDQGWSPSKDYYPVIKAIEAKLKEKNSA